MTSNFIEWNTEDVINWIRRDVKLLNLNFDLIYSHEITGRDLIDLSEDNLKEDLKILKLHDRKHLMRKICELMRNLAEADLNETPYQQDGEIHKENSNSEMKTLKVIFEAKTILLKCFSNIKVEHVIKECIDVFGLKKKNNNVICLDKTNNKHTDCLGVNDFYLSDKNSVILPKENFICDIFQDFFSINDDITFHLHMNKFDFTTNIKNNIVSNQIDEINQPIKINGFNKNNKEIQSKSHTDCSRSKKINNKSSNEDSYDRSTRDNNLHKDFSITETAVKNKYVSFEALDNLEKNGYSFINKRVNQNLNKTKEEIVTINSFYNLSNVNNYNEKSQCNSKENLNSKEARHIILSSSHKKVNLIKSNKKKEKISRLSYNSKRLNFDEGSDFDTGKSTQIKMENFKEKESYSKSKIELDEYMKRISYRTSVNTSHESERNKDKNNFSSNNTKINYNQENTPISFRSDLNKQEQTKLHNKSNEEEIENFLNTIKNRNSSTNLSTSHNNSQFNHNLNTNTKITPFQGCYTTGTKIQAPKKNIRQLIYRNIATETNDKNIDISDSN